MSFVCHQCGKVHDGLSFAYSAPAPADYYSIPESLRDYSAVLLPEQCIIGEDGFFVRGCLEVPIIGSSEVFSWGVWVLLSQQHFERMGELSETEGRDSEPAYPGLLGTELPFYPDTLSLKAKVHTRPVGQRPFVELEPTDHPLAVEQRAGITMETARRIAEMLEHQVPTNNLSDPEPEPDEHKAKKLPWWRFFGS